MNTIVQEDRHAATRALWRAGQIWETVIDGETVWTPVGQGGRAEPLWDQHQAYRQRAPVPRFVATSDAELCDALKHWHEQSDGITVGVPSELIAALVERLS